MNIDILFLIACTAVILSCAFTTLMDYLSGESTGETWRRMDRLEIMLMAIILHQGIPFNTENDKKHEPNPNPDENSRNKGL